MIYFFKSTRFSGISRICRKMSGISLAITLSLAVAGLFASCGSDTAHDHEGHSHSHEEHDHAHEGHSHEDHDHDGHDHDGHEDGDHDGEGKGHSDEIIFPAAKAKAAGVEVSVITPGEFNEVIPTSGRILSAAGSESTAVATQAGIVRLTKPWSVGMSVGSGTPLFTISNSKLPEGDVAGRAKIEYNRAKAEYERLEKLHSEKLATEQEYRDAKAAYENARLAYEATGAGHTGGTTVTAPKGGYVLECMVKDGDYVDVGTPLMTITQNRRLQLQADLPQRYAEALEYITSANFKSGSSDQVYSVRELNGRVVSHGSQAAAGSTFIPVIFEFDNARGVVAGSFAEVYLITVPRPSVMSVPKAALTEDQGVYAVYVQHDEEGYERRVVNIGKSDGRNVEILSGIKPGEKVVTKGAVHVKLASASKAIPGHTHNH